MEIVGGFMVMMSILGFFIALVWLAMPFMLLGLKGKQDRTFETVERIERRLSTIEAELALIREGDGTGGISQSPLSKRGDCGD